MFVHSPNRWHRPVCRGTWYRMDLVIHSQTLFRTVCIRFDKTGIHKKGSIAIKGLPVSTFDGVCALHPYFFYVAGIGDKGQIEPIFPNIEDGDQIAEVGLGSENMAGNALIRLDTRTLDHYKIIVCKKAINHHLLSKSGFTSIIRGNSDTTRCNPLERIPMGRGHGESKQS